MSEAYQCDRCGDLYPDSPALLVWISDDTHPSFRASAEGKVGEELCEECATGLVRFLGRDENQSITSG